MRTLKVGQKVELNALGKERVERRLGKVRRNGEIVGLSLAYPESYRIKWKTRKTIDMLHCNFVMAAEKDAEPHREMYARLSVEELAVERKMIDAMPHGATPGELDDADMLRLRHLAAWGYEHNKRLGRLGTAASRHIGLCAGSHFTEDNF